MQCIWSAVLLRNSDLLDVMLSQLYTFTNMSKEPTAPSSTGRRFTVLPEVAGSKHQQNGTAFLTDFTTVTVSCFSVLNSVCSDTNMI